MKGTATFDRTSGQATVKFPDAPRPQVRQMLKDWRFRYDGAAWRRDLEFSWDRFAVEMNRVGADLEFIEVRSDGARRLELALVRGYHRLVPTAEMPVEQVQPAPAEPRIIEATRCWECGRLRALNHADQPELNRRLAAAVAAFRVELEAAGETPLLAAAPIPEGVTVVGTYYCGC